MKKRTHYRKFIEPIGGGWSQWQEFGRTTYLACCDCGLVHGIKVKVYLFPKDKTATVFISMRRHKTRTKARRKQIKHAFQ